jgi:hypothetical protein
MGRPCCSFAWVYVCASALLGACSYFVPDTRTPTDQAKAVEPKCRTAAADEAAAVAIAGNIERVEPSYARVLGGPNASEARLRGARIHLRPMAGATRESLTRALECHEARVTLGATAATDDPYFLPGRWLKIEVASEDDGFVASVETDDHDVAQAVLDRARRYLAARTPRAPSER